MPDQNENRVLIVDDNPALHDDLQPFFHRMEADTQRFALKPQTGPSPLSKIQVEFAADGEDGLKKIELSMAEDISYAIVLIEIHLPVSSGIETAHRIWRRWPKQHIALCSNRGSEPWIEILSGFDKTDRLFVLSKPISPIEVYQLVNNVAHKQRREEKTESQIMQLRQTALKKTRELQQTIDHRNRIEVAWRANLDSVQPEEETDQVTGVYHEEAILNQLQRISAETTEADRPFSVLSIDIDHFKAINGTYGHKAGDEVLRTVARLLASTLRPADKLGRYGGKEFIIILPNCEIENGYLVGERLRSLVSHESIKINNEIIPVTISLGVTSGNGQEQSAKQLIRKACSALAQAKEGGRDRVEIEPSNVANLFENRPFFDSLSEVDP